MDEMQAVRKLGRSKIIFIMIACLVLSGILIFLGVKQVQSKDNYVEATATIEYIHVGDSESAGDNSYTIIDFYDADGNFHDDVTYEGYSSSYKVGKEIKIYYNINDYTDIRTSGDSFMLLIVGIIFGIIGIIGIISQIRHLKADKEDEEFYGDYDSKKDSSDFDAYENKKIYYFHPTKNSSRNFILEDENKNVVYEALTTKFRLFSASDYTFNNHYTNRKIEHKIGKKVTSQVSDGSRSYITNTITTDVKLKIDDENFESILRRKNIYIDFNGNPLSPTFDVYIDNKKCAYIETTAVNQTATTGFTSKIKVMGFFKITISDEDQLDNIFFAAFLIGYIS